MIDPRLLRSALSDDPDPDSPDVPEPRGPEPKEPDDNRTLSSPINELESAALQPAQGADLRRDQRQAGARRDRPPARARRCLRCADRRVRQLARRPCGERRHHPRHDPLRGRSRPGAHHRHRLGRERRRPDLPRRPPRSGASACPTRASCCTSRWAACAARRSTSTSRRARSSRCASASTRSSPAKPASRSRRSSRDTDRNYWMSAEEAIAYGMLDRIIARLSELPTA